MLWYFDEVVLGAELNLLFLLWVGHAENTQERWRVCLANNVIEIDPLSGKYSTHKYELPHTQEIFSRYWENTFMPDSCCLSFDTCMPWFTSRGSLGTRLCVFCKLQVSTPAAAPSHARFLSSHYVQINTFLARGDTKMVRALTMWQHSPDKEYTDNTDLINNSECLMHYIQGFFLSSL